jgi:hypothetical protein
MIRRNINPKVPAVLIARITTGHDHHDINWRAWVKYCPAPIFFSCIFHESTSPHITIVFPQNNHTASSGQVCANSQSASVKYHAIVVN